MKIGIEARGLSVKGGPRTYILNLVGSLIKIDKTNQYILFYDNEKHLDTFGNVEEIAIKIHAQALCPIWHQILLPLQLKKNKIDLVHNTKNSGSIFQPCKSVVTIHDIIPYLYRKTEKFSDHIFWRLNISSVAKNVNQIITDSEYSKKDIVNYLKIDPDKINVIYLAAGEEFKVIKNEIKINQIKSKFKLPENFILYVGTLQPRKNLSLLIKAYAKLIKNGKITQKLFIVGGSGWRFSNLVKLIESLNLEKNVIFSGYIPDECLPDLYNAADLFVFPSLYEGFGIPPLEAMCCGTPVVTSNSSSLPEVVGDAGILVNPYDSDELAKKMYEVLTNDGLRQDMIKKGLERAKMFSWEKAAKETVKVYENVSN